MKKNLLTFAFTFLVGLCTHAQILNSQYYNGNRASETELVFTQKVNEISEEIDLIIERNKNALKLDLNEIQNELNQKHITKEQSDSLRVVKTEFYANKIEEETKLKEDEIKKLINAKIEKNIDLDGEMSAYQKRLIENKTLAVVEYRFGKSFLTNNEGNDVSSGLVSSFGVGIGAKTRLGKEKSSYFWKSSIDASFNFFKVNNNKTIVNENGMTVLKDVGFPVKKSNMNMVGFKWSNYLEYDFSKHKTDEFGNKIIKSRQSFFGGLGGFIGYNQVSKQLVYEKDGEEYTETTLSKYNTNRFVYGVGAYAGYQNFSLRAEYNMNNIFKKSFADQNIFTVSLVIELL